MQNVVFVPPGTRNPIPDGDPLVSPGSAQHPHMVALAAAKKKTGLDEDYDGVGCRRQSEDTVGGRGVDSWHSPSCPSCCPKSWAADRHDQPRCHHPTLYPQKNLTSAGKPTKGPWFPYSPSRAGLGGASMGALLSSPERMLRSDARRATIPALVAKPPVRCSASPTLLRKLLVGHLAGV